MKNLKPQIPPGLFHVNKGSNHLLLHPDKPRWMLVNDLGWEIARLCDGSRGIGDIAELLAKKYNKKLAIVLSDVEIYLNHLSLKNFLHNGIPSPKRYSEVSLKRLHLNITENCNLRCIHCGVVDDTPKNDGLKSKKVFEIIDELSNTGDSALAVSGGEPLLHKDCLEILRYASERVKTSLSTNATLIDDSIARDLSSLDIDLQISLDGSTPSCHDSVRGEGTFEKTLNGIRLLQKYGAGENITLFSTVMRHNIDLVPGLIKLAEELNIPSIRFLPLQRVGASISSWNSISPTHQQYTNLYTYLYRELTGTSVRIDGGFQGFLLKIPGDTRWCRLGETLAIDSKGGIYPCSLMVHRDFFIGNIHDMTLKDALKSNKLKDLIDKCSKREKYIERCKDCAWKNLCQASCPGSVFFLKGTLGDTDDLCELRQRLYPEVIFDMVEKRVDSSALRQSMECEI